MTLLYEYTIEELHNQLVSGDLTVVDLVTAAYDQIEAYDDQVGSFLSLRKEEALEEACALDEKGVDPEKVLEGIPISVKDNILSVDQPSTAASKMLENFTSVYDATVVKKLKDAGAIIIGKVNLDEFAMGGTTETSYFKVTHNPWNLNRVPGGSSGGSAASVASGMVMGSLGSDTGGSIRQPAAYNNVVGMKPTYGTVSRYGAVSFGSSLDQIGPLTRTIKDNALLLQTIAGQDDFDVTSADHQVDYLGQVDQGVKGLTIGVAKEMIDNESVSPDIREVVQSALKVFKYQGAEIKEISLPHLKYAAATYYAISSAEASSNLQRFDGIRYGHRSKAAEDLEDIYVLSRSEGFGKEVKARILMGNYILGSENYEKFFEQAAKIRTLLREDFAAAFADVDVILAPTATSIAPHLKSVQTAEEKHDPLDAYLDDVLTVSANLVGIPALSVPCGFSEGMPVGLQIFGNYFAEDMIYRVGQAFEDATNYHLERPNFERGEI